MCGGTAATANALAAVQIVLAMSPPGAQLGGGSRAEPFGGRRDEPRLKARARGTQGRVLKVAKCGGAVHAADKSIERDMLAASTTVPGLDEQVSWLLGDISVVDRIQERLEAEAYPDGEVDLTRPDGQYGVAVMLGLPWALRCTRELGLSGRIQRRLERRMLQRADGVLAGPLYAQAEVLLGLG